MRSLLIKIAYICLFVGGGFIGLFLFDKAVMPLVVGSGKAYPVPNVVGLNVDEAQTLVEEQGFNFKIIREQFSAELPAGTIIKQIPKGGSPAKKGRTIRVIVSKGGMIAVVPDVRGILLRQAKLKLEAVGLVPGDVIEQYCDTVDRGFVIRTIPEPGETLSQGDTVSLMVSRGSATQLITVPNVVGMKFEQARKTLQSVGLKAIIVVRVIPAISPGEVYRQVPPAGTKVYIGSGVKIVVNKWE